MPSCCSATRSLLQLFRVYLQASSSCYAMLRLLSGNGDHSVTSQKSLEGVFSFEFHDKVCIRFPHFHSATDHQSSGHQGSSRPGRLASPNTIIRDTRRLDNMLFNGGATNEKQVNGGTAVFQHSPETKDLQKEKEAGCQADEVSPQCY